MYNRALYFLYNNAQTSNSTNHAQTSNSVNHAQTSNSVNHAQTSNSATTHRLQTPQTTHRLQTPLTTYRLRTPPTTHRLHPILTLKSQLNLLCLSLVFLDSRTTDHRACNVLPPCKSSSTPSSPSRCPGSECCIVCTQRLNPPGGRLCLPACPL